MGLPAAAHSYWKCRQYAKWTANRAEREVADVRSGSFT